MKNMLVSLFKGYSDTCPTEVTLQQIVDLIRQDASVASLTEKHRYYLKEQMAGASQREKRSCPCFAVSVRFEGGKSKTDLKGWTGLCMADFDHLPPESMETALQAVRQDPHTVMAYTTISGQGIRVVAAYRIKPTDSERIAAHRHQLAFQQINRHYAELTGHPFDEKCKNATRLSGLAHDPTVFFNPEAVPFEVAMTAINSKRPSISSQQKMLQRAVTEAEQQLADEGVAYTEHHHNEYIMRMGYLLNSYGIEQEAVTQWAVERFAGYDGDVAGIIRSCYQHTDEHGTRQLPSRKREKEERASTYATVAEIEEFLNSQGRFRKNTVTGKYEFEAAGTQEFEDLTDLFVNSLWCRMCKEAKATRLSDLRTVIQSNFAELFNPFTDYLDNLPPWDGKTDYIGQLAAQVHVKEGEALFGTFFKKWLVGMLAALTDSETVNHEILVLIGRQGIYKTTWLNNLLPPELRQYFYLKTNSRRITKDDLLTLSEFAIVCLEELDEMDAQEVNQLKALTTMRYVNERAAYAHFKEVRPHIASFCGTSNNTHFLTDLSGNRRWMPFEVESIDSPYNHPIDYAGVYAQATSLLKGNFHYWLEEEEIRLLNIHNKQFEVPCLEQELILTHYRRPMEGEKCIFVTNAQILSRINAGLRQKLSPVKIGIIMKQEGFEPLRYGGKRGYRVVELSGDEIYRNQQAMGRIL